MSCSLIFRFPLTHDSCHIFFPPQAEMAKRNSVGSHDMPRQNAFRPAYGTAQDSDDVSNNNPCKSKCFWHHTEGIEGFDVKKKL